MPLEHAQERVLLVPYETDCALPIDKITHLIEESLRSRKGNRVAVMGDVEYLEALHLPDAEYLVSERNYQWSGFLVQKRVEKPPSRVIQGDYTEWFQWYMRHQRFRAFHTIVLIEPSDAVGDKNHGGYIDGFLARLMGKAQHTIVVSKQGALSLPAGNDQHLKEVTRALLYGTRLSRKELLEQASRTFVPSSYQRLENLLSTGNWRISKHHPRYRLRELDEELVQGMIARPPPYDPDEEPKEVEQLFERRKKLVAEVRVSQTMLQEKALEDVREKGWVSAPDEALSVSAWLQELSKEQDERVVRLFKDQEHLSDEEVSQVLNPRRWQVRKALDELVANGRLAKGTWFKEVGRPSMAYFLPGKAPFLQERCGQCAFYVSLKRRCRLWWLANKKRPFFDPEWEKAGANVTDFDRHKMKFASRIGPHSSACLRFLDKKRDHLRKTVPDSCEVCSEPLSKAAAGRSTICGKCGTVYVRRTDKVRVYTSYRHEFDRLYKEITGSDAEDDMQALKAEWADSRIPMGDFSEELEIPTTDFVDEPQERTSQQWYWPSFNQALQSRVDRLRTEGDVTKQLSMAMVQSAYNATKAIANFAKISDAEVERALRSQQRCISRTNDTKSPSLLPYEALVMKEYWFCYNLALKKAEAWFGPRTKSRFVREFVEDPDARARGYSAIDAAINYLHQRRVKQSLQTNADLGFHGICDGFLHKKRYNSRGIGLIFDMIDPFKFADREVLLTVVLNGGLSWKDFTMDTDRRGSTFYYPTQKGKAILDQAGIDADAVVVRYRNRLMKIVEAYREFASSLFDALQPADSSGKLEPFAFTVE